MKVLTYIKRFCILNRLQMRRYSTSTSTGTGTDVPSFMHEVQVLYVYSGLRLVIDIVYVIRRHSRTS